MRSLTLICASLAAVLVLGSAQVRAGGDSEDQASAEEAMRDAAKDLDNPPLSSNMVAWLSSQAEKIVEELEAIAKRNAENKNFSVINYLRYLNQYNKLKVLARQEVSALEWVKAKASGFSQIYKSAVELISDYLENLHSQLSAIESKEAKSTQRAVGKDWLELYETVSYIESQAPQKSKIKKRARELLIYSPNDTEGKVRFDRYKNKYVAFSR